MFSIVRNLPLVPCSLRTAIKEKLVRSADDAVKSQRDTYTLNLLSLNMGHINIGLRVLQDIRSFRHILEGVPIVLRYPI